MSTRKLFITLMLMFLTCAAVFAQVTTGTISGTVTDNTGAALPNTRVVVMNEDTGISRAITTDATGRYSAPSLNPGRYKVTASHDGFQEFVRGGIDLSVGRVALVDMTMGLGSVDQKMEVNGEAPLVESTTAALSSLVDARAIRALPLNGRSYEQLALIQPGVTTNNPGQTGGTPYAFGTGKRFNVGGQRGTSNSFLLDGTNVNDQGNSTPGGAAGTNLGVDTILEFKVFTNSFKAEYGRASGSIITAVTRSGTNNFHGTAFEYIRNSALDAKNYFDTTPDPAPFKRNQFGGVFGGPIIKNKTFFFTGYEGLRQGLSTNQTAIVPTALAKQGIFPNGTTVTVSPAMVPYLNIYPAVNGRDFGDGTGEYRSSPNAITNEDNVMGRIDHQISSGTTIFGRYTFDTDNSNQPSNLPDMLVTQLESRRQYVALEANSTLGPRMVNNFRFGFNRTRSSYTPVMNPSIPASLSFVPGEQLGALQIGGTVQPGAKALTPIGSPSAGTSTRAWAFNTWEWADDISYITGKHTFKTGVDIQRIQDNTSSGNYVRGSYTFSTYANFLKGIPSTLQAAAPVGVLPTWNLRQSIIGLYAQDDYAVTQRLTLNLGLRWEMATDPKDARGQMSILKNLSDPSMTVSDSFFTVGKKNFQPRFGMAWRVNESGKTVVRAAAGIYHNEILPWAYALNISNPPFYGRYSASNPPFPNGSSVLKPGTTLAVSTFTPLEKTPVSYQWNASVQQELIKNTVFQISYAGNRSRHLETEREANTSIPTFPNGDTSKVTYAASTPRLNPAFAAVTLLEMNGNSTYNSMTVLLRKQSSNGFQGQIFYTLSKAMDINSSVSGSDSVRSYQASMNPYNLYQDWGLADFDERHHVGLNFSYPIPFKTDSKAGGFFINGWTLDGIATFSSGMPFTARLATPVSRDAAGNTAERPNVNAGFSANPTSGVSAGCKNSSGVYIIDPNTPLGTAAHWFDPCAFSSPTAGTYGNAPRNSIIGPGIQDVDLAIEKNFKMGEKAFVTFKAEMFNVLNHANFGLPNSVATTSAAGVISYSTTSARQLQFALRVGF